MFLVAADGRCSYLAGRADLQNVTVTLRVLFRPEVAHLPDIYRGLGVDYDERVLPSIANEVLKAVVAQVRFFVGVCILCVHKHCMCACALYACALHV